MGESMLMVDVIGVITEAQGVTSLTTKAGDPCDKQSVTIADDSNISVNLTFWRDAAHDEALQVGTIIAIKGAKISSYGGVSLNVSFDHA